MQVYIVTYDICDDKRLRAIYSTLRRWGDHLQYSVFRCELSLPDLERLKSELDAILHHTEDQVLFFDLGPSAGRGRDSTTWLGATYTHPERHAIIV